jgi:hypothetical protein
MVTVSEVFTSLVTGTRGTIRKAHTAQASKEILVCKGEKMLFHSQTRNSDTSGSALTLFELGETVAFN